MKSTREKVLQTLASNPKATIVDIAHDVGINAISVRHHLTSLQVDGLVSAEEERHGVGRPRLVYSLTDAGMEKFPTKYFSLTNHLLRQIKETLPENEVKDLFVKMARDLSSQYQQQMKNLNFSERLVLLKDILSKEGYEISWKNTVDGVVIQEVNCPFPQIGKSHPEICIFDKALISQLLEIPENKIRHIKNSDHSCCFEITSLDK